MRFSQLFVNTLKESPKDAVLKSHQYLIRGGFIQQIGSGIYNFLPLEIGRASCRERVYPVV